MKGIMEMMKRIKLIILSLTLVIVCGCSGLKLVEYPPYSGFLDSYEGLYRSNVIKGMFIVDNPHNKIVRLRVLILPRETDKMIEPSFLHVSRPFLRREFMQQNFKK